MPSDFHRTIHHRPQFSQKSYHMLMKTMQNSLAIEISDVAAFRHHVISYYYTYGLQQTLAAFKLKKTTLHTWKRTYETHGKRIISLVPRKTRPVHVREMKTDWRLVEFIKQMRVEHGNIGKAMLKPFVDAYAKEIGIPSLAESTIGKVIKRRHLTFEKKRYSKRANKFKKLRTRKSPKVQSSGFMSSIQFFRQLFSVSLNDFYTFV
jgi:hypothetical protein